ncbi:MAG: ABC transporter ATP-binding protein [Spirochaetales bacterium]|nr:ABC transporter ATP-binding protein [Spirochaetales bacterium]
MNNILIENLYKSYNNGNESLPILTDLNLVIETNTRVILTGNSGSGKSTLLNLISGMDRLTSGTIIVNDHPVHKLDENALASFRSNSIGLIFQFHYLLKDFTAVENVMLPAYMTGMDKMEAMDRARQLLIEVGLGDRLNHIPSRLSGGEKQRVAVVRSLINDPGIILADEPTGNLDDSNSRKVEELLFELVINHGKTLLLVTHDIVLAGKGDRQLQLDNGKLVEL